MGKSKEGPLQWPLSRFFSGCPPRYSRHGKRLEATLIFLVPFALLPPATSSPPSQHCYLAHSYTAHPETQTILQTKWAATTVKVRTEPVVSHMPLFYPAADSTPCLGGKVKPLKQAKKQAKDLDDDDKAFLEKKRAGTI